MLIPPPWKQTQQDQNGNVKAVVSYIYIIVLFFHLGFYLFAFDSNGKSNPLAVWSRPMLVRGPVGIVSGVEVAFLLMFIALLVWSFPLTSTTASPFVLRSGCVDNLHFESINFSW